MDVAKEEEESVYIWVEEVVAMGGRLRSKDTEWTERVDILHRLKSLLREPHFHILLETTPPPPELLYLKAVLEKEVFEGGYLNRAKC